MLWCDVTTIWTLPLPLEASSKDSCSVPRAETPGDKLLAPRLHLRTDLERRAGETFLEGAENIYIILCFKVLVVFIYIYIYIYMCIVSIFSVIDLLLV